MKTYVQKTAEARSSQRWHVIDADGIILGRLATQAASLIRGKHKPTFTPHVACGDCVVIINAEKIKLTGNKLEDKMYYHHTGYIGGIKEYSAGDLMRTKPQEIIERAVCGMLPKGPLGRRMRKQLKIYVGGEHPHAAQSPEQFQIQA